MDTQASSRARNDEADSAPAMRFAQRCRSLSTALLIASLLRLFYSACAALFSARLELDTAQVRSNHFTDNLIPQSDIVRYGLLGVWERFDTLWYIHMAATGYDRPETVVFPPLYPLLIRFAALFTGTPLVAALVVSSLASFFLFWAFHRLAVLELPPEIARRALLFYAVWPAAFIFFAGYPDSLTIALMLWALVFARSEHWWAAGVCGLLAGLTKAVGLLIVVPLVVIALRKRCWRAVPILLSAAGYPLYAAWLFFTDRMLPAESYARFWGTVIAPPWETVSFSVRNALAGSGAARLQLPAGLLTAALALWKRPRPEYTLYVLAVLMFVLTKKSDPSQHQLARYLLILFPAPLHLAVFLQDKAVVLAALLTLLSVNLVFFWGYLNWSLIA
ncbi:MAG: hypothetical protein IT158_29495 [Bryobacterales bacterium]|nr:hypothetical protein [Bryobacterales bacterium]